MLLKGILCWCIQALLFKSVFTQCIPLFPREPACSAKTSFVEGYNLDGAATITPFYGRVIGGNLIIDTTAPHAHIRPAGVTIFSENLIIEGAVLVSGNLPFVGTVGLEGVVPASGNSAVNYACGTGDIGIVDIQGPITDVLAPAGGISGPGCFGYNTIGLRL